MKPTVSESEIDDYVERHNAPIIRTIYKMLLEGHEPQSNWRWLRRVIDQDLHPGDPRMLEDEDDN